MPTLPTFSSPTPPPAHPAAEPSNQYGIPYGSPYGSPAEQNAPVHTEEQSWNGPSNDRPMVGEPSPAAPTNTFAPNAFGAPNPQSFPLNSAPASGAPHRKGQKRKRVLGTGGIIGIAAATALVVGAGSGIGTWLLLPHNSNSTVTSSGTVVQATANDTNWTAVAQQVQNSVVSVQVETREGIGQGSGVIWDNQGHIVTNNHVVEGATGNVVVTIGNRGYEASVLGTDPANDLAVLKLTTLPDSLVPIAQGDSKSVEVGDAVMAIGSPLGLSGSYTTGIVSALDRPVTTGEVNGNSVVTNAIQTSAALNPGNSGGALVNASGQLIGINSSIATLGSSSSEGSQSGSIGIGFAIPSALVENVAEQLITDGTVQHAWLGTTNTDGQAQLQDGIILGAQVQDVTNGGPAASAGVQKGDLIIGVDDQQVSSSASLVGVIRTYSVGDKVKLTVIRGGNQSDIEVTLGVSPTLNE